MGEHLKTKFMFGAISGWNPTLHKRVGMLFTCSAFLLFYLVQGSSQRWRQMCTQSINISTANLANLQNGYLLCLCHLVLRYRHRFCGFLRRRRPHGHMKKVEQNRVLTTAHWEIFPMIFFHTFYESIYNVASTTK